MRGPIAASLLLAPGALALPPASSSFHNSENGVQILLGKSRSSSSASSDRSSSPATDTIICPLSGAIIPIYGPPSQHHSYVTAVNTFCRRDLPHIQHGSPHTTSSTPPADLSSRRSSSSSSSSSPASSNNFLTKDSDDASSSPPPSSSASSPPIVVSLPPATSLARSYRITLVASDGGEAERLDWVWHQLQLEIENRDEASGVSVSEDECVANFMKIVEAAGGCRVSDVLTKPGEFRVGRGDGGRRGVRGLEGVVFRAEQWK
jgi:hypothetical protein